MESRRGDRRKVLLAMVIRESTGAENRWIAEGLVMGSPTSVIRLVSAGRKGRGMVREKDGLLRRIAAATSE